jgi:hypothetical protein
MADCVVIPFCDCTGGIDGEGSRAVRRLSAGKRGAVFQARLVRHCGQRVRLCGLGGLRKDELRFRRFLHNPAVTVPDLLQRSRERTAQRCAGLEVLAIQDTTVIRPDGHGGGRYLHGMIAVDAASDALLGPVHGEILVHDGGKRGERRARTTPEKESQRWLRGAQAAEQVCAAASRITVIADRESDIYAAFAQRPERVNLVVRAAQDRALDDEGRLFARADGTAPVGERPFDVPGVPGRAPRQITLQARIIPVELKRPAHLWKEKLAPHVAMTLVDLREAGASDAHPREGAVHWRLLTTLPMADADAAFGLAALYRRRWEIEQVFRTLKLSGFDIENVRMADDAAHARLAAACFVAAVEVQQLVHARDAHQAPPAMQRPLTDVFQPQDQAVLERLSDSLEGATAKQKNPHAKGTLGFATWVAARLGGWTGYYGKPGPKIIARGWNDIHIALRTAHLLQRTGKDV